ncbi:MAG: hypothetical protein E6Q97_36360 [Desulfurellales bacterium]|nr:MAG: hypothetical protein E6Q97_36360 [Desulfurellales bacterium]
MTVLHQSAQHILQADTRYVISRNVWQWPVSLAGTCFVPDPSDHRSDLVWEEDVAHIMRRQQSITGPDGSFPVVNYRMKGTRRWDIPLRVTRTLNAPLEDGEADPAINPRKRRLRNAIFKARMEREIQSAQIIKDPAIVTQNITLGATERFDAIASTSSDPMAVLRVACRKINEGTGLKVTDIIIPQAGYLEMCRHEKIMAEAVNKLNLTSDRVTIDNNIIERLIDDDLIEKGAVKTYKVWFNNTDDGPHATDLIKRVYPMGNMVIVLARAKAGGSGDQSDYGFGLLKYWDVVKQAFPNDPEVEIVTGNEGFGVYNFPLFDVAGGGDQSQLADAAVPFVQQELAAFAIYGAFNAANTAAYGDLFSSY